ncbi:Trafficking protein particle complex subunit like protein [Argiope bruennichi]|uniref:Trafficking protein particle complex subunit like protein n=1 Tax=Argiope bruennichi TaxID=94029 RepID=A0A8T0EIK8_ARGBR|nr:Trafficking protein particle complex subunit like protein [Argiope bruennichi]
MPCSSNDAICSGIVAVCCLQNQVRMFKTIDKLDGCEMRSVILRLIGRNVSAAEIYLYMIEMYGISAMSGNKVLEWVKVFKDAWKNVLDEQRSNRLSMISEDSPVCIVLDRKTSTMATCKQTAYELIQDVFSPCIAVLCSSDVEQICAKNNLTFVQMVQPFCRLNTEGIFVVSSSHQDPLSQINELSQQLTQHQNNHSSRWFFSYVFTYYLLLHDVSSDDLGKAEAVYQSMKSSFGATSCHLLQINSIPESAQTSNNSKDSNDTVMADPWSQFLPKYYVQNNISNNQTSEENSIDVTDEYKGGDSTSKCMQESGAIHHPLLYNSDTDAFSSDSPQLLAQFICFRKKYTEVTIMSENTDTFYIQNRCLILPELATRATFLSTECLKSKSLYSEAAIQFVRMPSEADLPSALCLEQAAYCYIHCKIPKIRKFAFHIILAGHRFSKSGQRKHALRSYKQAEQIDKITDYIETMVLPQVMIEPRQEKKELNQVSLVQISCISKDWCFLPSEDNCRKVSSQKVKVFSHIPMGRVEAEDIIPENEESEVDQLHSSVPSDLAVTAMLKCSLTHPFQVLHNFSEKSSGAYNPEDGYGHLVQRFTWVNGTKRELHVKPHGTVQVPLQAMFCAPGTYNLGNLNILVNAGKDSLFVYPLPPYLLIINSSSMT